MIIKLHYGIILMYIMGVLYPFLERFNCNMDIIKATMIDKYLNSAPDGIPILICTDKPRVTKKINESNYHILSVNSLLSKELIQYHQDERIEKVEDSFRSLIKPYEYVLITDFEMLFDPRYKLNVLKLFCDIARFNKICVKWPGKYTDGNLTYAEIEDLDYHKYDCSMYQVHIVL